MSLGIIENYQDLQDNMADYLDRSDLVVQIPGFIQLGEASMNRVLRLQIQICRGQTVGSRTDIFIPLPLDWLEARNVEVVTLKDNPDDPGNLIDDKTFQASYQSSDVIDQMNEDNVQYRPHNEVNYTFNGNNIEIYPNPSDQFRIVLEYYGKVGPLSAENDVNAILQDHPDMYLYGSLIAAAPFLRDDPRIATWKSLYELAVNTAMAGSVKALTSGSRLTRKVNVRM
jgi:hypothetical protein